MGEKKSEFTALTVVDNASTFDFVVNGQNFKITKADFLAALGVTGTIEQDGAVTGTPVLDLSSVPTYKVRNIEDGNGILSSISAENGLTIQHNFDQDGTGIAIVNNLASASPDFISLIAGGGIDLDLVVNALTITAVGLPDPVILEPDAAFNVSDTDSDIFDCNGTFTATFPAIATATREFTISSTVGSITLAGDATIQGTNPLTTGTSGTYYPARGQWKRK